MAMSRESGVGKAMNPGTREGEGQSRAGDLPTPTELQILVMGLCRPKRTLLHIEIREGWHLHM